MHLHKGITGQDERRDADPAVWTSRSHGAKRQVLVERRVVDPPAYADTDRLKDWRVRRQNRAKR